MNFIRRTFLATAALSSASIALGSKADAQSTSQTSAPMDWEMVYSLILNRRTAEQTTSG